MYARYDIDGNPEPYSLDEALSMMMKNEDGDYVVAVFNEQECKMLGTGVINISKMTVDLNGETVQVKFDDKEGVFVI